jgi:2-polyprenyl-3-methyl-5-hydroxy-6-metoxy-1,4-benzoquinol methylase
MGTYEPFENDPEKRVNFFLEEYESRNPISRLLFDNLFRTISKIKPYLKPGSKLLEVGCGMGISSLTLNDMLPGHNFEASEVDDIFVQKMLSSNFPLKVTHESVLDLQRENHSFDCIFCLEVLEHIEQYEKALSELFRVARGYVVISVPNEPLWRILNMLRGKYIPSYGNTPGHINHWSSKTLKDLISKYGVVQRIFLPIPWIVVLAKTRN